MKKKSKENKTWEQRKEGGWNWHKERWERENITEGLMV